MRQNGATISLLLDCVSYEILCETRIKPSFFGNCLIFLSSALGQLRASQWPLALSVTADAVPAPPKGEPSLASPLGGRWCPVGTVQRLTEPAGESGLALARTERASCRPHHPLPWLSPLRARPPRSLVSFWLRAHKVKGKVEAFLKRKRVRPADVPQKTLISLRSAPGAHVRFSLAQA